MLKIKTLLLVASIAPFVLNAQNLLTNGNAEADLEGWSEDQVQVVNENSHAGKNCFKSLEPEIRNSQIIPVDTSNTYKLSGCIKSADAKKPNVYLGLIPFDANKVQINCQNVNFVAGTETELAEACKPTDTVVRVKDASKWQLADKVDVIAFDISDNYKDIPNRNISAGVVIKVENKNNVWELTLDKPCGQAYPVGAKVRQHKYSGTYIYTFYQGQFNSTNWKLVSGTTPLWLGTKYVQVAILTLGGGMIYFDDIKLEQEQK